MKALLCILGFTGVTIAAYSPWAFAASRIGSTLGLYLACAVFFLGLGPLAIYPMVKEACGRARFFGFFFLSFLAYAVAWSVLWFFFHDKFGEIFGSLIGLVAMAAILKAGIGRPEQVLSGAGILFLFHTAGYHLGDLIHQEFGISHRTLARLGWGLFHGLGFGTGLVLSLKGSGTPKSGSSEKPSEIQ